MCITSLDIDEVQIANAAGLLEEVLANGEKGIESLYAWFLSERNLVKNTIKGLNEIEA